MSKKQNNIFGSENFYRNLVENSQDMIFVVDRQLRIQFVNHIAAKAVGLQKAEIIGRKVVDIFPPAVGKRQSDHVRAVLKSGKSAYFEELSNMKGSDIWLGTSLVPIKDKRNQVCGVQGVSRNITQRVIHTEPLKVGKQENKFITDILSDVIWSASIEGIEKALKLLNQKRPDLKKVAKLLRIRFSYVSPSIQEQRGYTPQEFRQMNFKETMTPASYRKAQQVLVEELMSESKKKVDPMRTRTIDAEAICKDGHRIFTEARVRFIRNEKGFPIGLTGISRDVTRRKEAEQALARFRLGIEKSPAAIYITDIDGNITYVNPGFEKVYGYSKEEIIGKNPKIWKSDRYDKKFYRNFWKQILSGKPVEVEFTNYRKDGKRVIMHSVVNPIYSDGKIDGFLAIQTNITNLREEQEKVEAYRDNLEALVEARTLSLKLEKMRVETLMENLAEGVIAIDLKGKIITYNRHAEKILGRPSKEVMGKSFMKEFCFLDAKGKAIRLNGPFIQSIINNRESAPIKATYSRPDGNIIQLSGMVAPYILDDDVTGVVGTFRDFTREAELDRSKSEFISLTSHQLRTPLTSIKWILEMALSRKDSLDSWQEEFLGDALRSTRRMIHLVSDLLNVSRLEAGVVNVESRKTNVAQLTKDVIEELVGFARSRNQKIGFKDPGPIWAHLDRQLIGQVISNLISNALHYSEGGSSIQVKLDNKQDMVRIQVIDKGAGISPEEQESLFQKFFRTATAAKLSTSGSGLGLYIVSKILQLCNGDIKVDSAVGKGSTFTVLLPLKGPVHKGDKKLAGERLS